jgi:NAD(P)-dependent dehydrogenase (short-subunit alcohol dehydrogenase family)
MTTQLPLAGKVAIVTGGAGGLGRATCEALAGAGARVLVVDIDVDGAQAVADAIGGQAFSADVSVLEDNLAMVNTARELYGQVHLVHLNAGVASFFDLDETFDLARYRRAMGINLDGVVFGVHASLGAFGPEGGAIVATASLAGLTGVPMDPVYAANKHGVVGLVRSLGPVLEARKVRVNAVCPGFAESAIIDPIRDALSQQQLPIIPAETVAQAVLTLFCGSMTGECWFVQAGREPAPFQFRGIPGPRSTQEVLP